MPLFKKFSFSIVMACLFLTIIISCKKEDTTDFIKQAKIATEYVKAEDDMADLFVLFHKALHDTILINKGEAKIDSALVIYTQNSSPTEAQFYFDYGNEGKVCPDGKLRKGQISAVLNKSFDLPDAVFTANFTNFKVDGSLLQGQYSYKNTGETFAGQLKYQIEMEVSFFSQLSKTLSLSAQRNLYWKSGYDKPYNPINHVFVMPGGAAAVYFGSDDSAAAQVTLTMTSLTDWVIQLSCFHPIKQGTFDIILDDGQKSVNLTGEFIDIDEDACAEKVFFKNADNSFGYPYYL